MLFRNPEKWRDIDGMRGLLFFVQRLDELTFPYSLDSYKSPTTSILGLLREFDSLLDLGGAPGKDHINKAVKAAALVLDEIKIRIKGNWIISILCRFNREELSNLSLSIDNFEDVRRKLSVISAELDVEAYISEIAGEVITLSAEKNAKKKLDFLAKEFASVLQYLGVSRDHINESVVSFFFGNIEITDTSQFKLFCQIVYPHHHKYRVVIGVPEVFNTIDPDVLGHYNITGEPQAMSGLDEGELVRLKQTYANRICVTCVVEATDYNSAVAKASNNIHAAHSLYRIFSHKDEIEISPIALAEQSCCEGVTKRVSLPKNNMHFIRDMRREKATSTMKRMKERIRLDVGPDALKFQNIVNIHGLSLGSSNADIQLVNLWTCLETIAPSSYNSSKINNVISSILPTLMLGYYNRLVVQLLFDLIRWNRKALSEALREIGDDADHDLKDKFLKLISDPGHTEALKELLRKCGDFELLRFRLYSLSEIATDCKKAYVRLEMHENMVKWQMHRIYRTRNKIVHAGESPGYTRYLVENAHDFFDLALLFCMELSASKPLFDRFSTCFDYADREYSNYKEQIKKGAVPILIWSLQKKKDRSFIFVD